MITGMRRARFWTATVVAAAASAAWAQPVPSTVYDYDNNGNLHVKKITAFDPACGAFVNTPDRCGACGNSCAMPAHGSATCTVACVETGCSGACGFVCSAGYYPSGPQCVSLVPGDPDISGLRAFRGLGQVRLTWNTALDSTTQVTYGVGASAAACTRLANGSSQYTKSHSVVVTGLAAGTTYTFCVASEGVPGWVDRANVTAATAESSAVYSQLLRAPYCPVSTDVARPRAACDSGPTLLAGKNAVEPNGPNALDAGFCPGEEHDGELRTLTIERIAVQTVDGSELVSGKRVEATIWVNPAQTTDTIDPCWDCDRLDVYYMPDHVYGAAAWQYLSTLHYTTAASSFPVPLKLEFTMGAGSRHALRANFRNTSEYNYGWDTRYPASCSPGHGDHDDLVFHVTTEPAPPCSSSMSTDPKNCGACGVVCQAGGPNTSSGCSGGTCYIACNAWYYDCNGAPGDGCESTDPLCGAAPACIPSGDPCSDSVECCSGYCYYGRGYSMCE